MKSLLVLRHAKSSWNDPALDDHERPLNKRGRRDGPRMGKLMRRRGLLPDLIISSDAVRARMTAEAVAAAARNAGEILLDSRLYLGSAADILSVLRTVRENAETVMIVGHNPGLEQLVEQLTGEQQDMPTAALAQIVLPIDRWRDLRARWRRLPSATAAGPGMLAAVHPGLSGPGGGSQAAGTARTRALRSSTRGTVVGHWRPKELI